MGFFFVRCYHNPTAMWDCGSQKRMKNTLCWYHFFLGFGPPLKRGQNIRRLCNFKGIFTIFEKSHFSIYMACLSVFGIVVASSFGG